jgi:eukaryotic-like serine/threonine-protein kinase
MVFRGQSLGKYRVIDTLGSGGFGTVYLAEDTWIDKRVALKIPHRQNLDFGDLLREPRLLAALNHPNIVTVVTAEKQDNVFFIVMEYVPGDTLESIIATHGPLDVPLALDYAGQILNAVEYAHKQGVIHRDLRPANVFVTAEGLVKVGDFGTSRFLEIAAHGTTVIGSPPYMAPEQFEGRAVFASDLYAVGVSLYQILTGTLPYDTPAPHDIDRLRRGELASPPRLRNPSIPAAVDRIVMRALAGEVSSRYQRAEDFLNDLLAARREIVRRPVAAASSSSSSSSSSTSTSTSVASGSEKPVPFQPPTVVSAPTPVTPGAARRVSAGRMHPRDVPPQRFCWHCRKPQPARGERCPFCGESQ